MIEIIDNFLDKDETELILKSINNFGFYLHSSVDKKRNFLAGYGNSEDILNIFLKVFDIPNISSSKHGRNLERYYVNLAPAGDWHSGSFHDDDGKLTALYYPIEWKPEWGGGTEFITGEIVQNVKNRLLLFDAKIEHRSMPHYNNEGWRFTLAFKTNLIWNDN
tara:strand:- start:69 stop:557 length:489 start_codon:yes stop_codon:yes gene_type:complete